MGCVLRLACLAVAGTAAAQTTPEPFTFRFNAGEAQTYAAAMHLRMSMDMSAGNDHMLQKMDMGARYNVTLTPAEGSTEGAARLHLTTADIEADWDMTLPSAHIVVSLKAGEMVGTRDGVVIIDTAHHIGTDEAEEIEKDLMPLYLSGYVVLDPRGQVIRFEGDPPFVKFWTDEGEGEVGFFTVVLPAKGVAVGDTWEEHTALHKLGSIRLEGEGLTCTATFKRAPDAIRDGRAVAVFNLDAPFDHQGLVGYLSEGGQRMKVNINRFKRTATGTTYFDADLGRLTEAGVTVDGTASMTGQLPDGTIQIEAKIGGDMHFRLVPPAAAVRVAHYLMPCPNAGT
jgi:hypothetical protein